MNNLHKIWLVLVDFICNLDALINFSIASSGLLMPIQNFSCEFMLKDQKFVLVPVFRF
jgi:hypothetical protein